MPDSIRLLESGFTDSQVLCQSDALVEGEALGVDLKQQGRDQFFLVRHKGTAYAWRNACPHINNAPMAWRKNAYLDATRQFVCCHAHGALFEPDSGKCIQGPCLGESLQRISICEVEGQVLLIESNKNNEVTT